VVAGLAIAILFAACSGSGTTKKRAAPVSTTFATSAAPTSTLTTAAPSTTRPGPAPCTTAGLEVSSESGQGAMGHEDAPIVFRNRGAGKCRLSGYPGVAGLDDAGHQVTEARRTAHGFMGGLPLENQTPPIVELAPGETASALVEGTSRPPDTVPSCASYAALLVTPPDETHSVRVAVALPACSGLEVHPVVPGPNGGAGA